MTNQRQFAKENIGKIFGKNNRPEKSYFLENNSGVTKVEQDHVPMKVMIETFMVSGERLENLKKEIFRLYKSEMYDSSTEGFELVEMPDRMPGYNRNDAFMDYRSAIRRIKERKMRNDFRREIYNTGTSSAKVTEIDNGYDSGTSRSEDDGVASVVGNERGEEGKVEE